MRTMEVEVGDEPEACCGAATGATETHDIMNILSQVLMLTLCMCTADSSTQETCLFTTGLFSLPVCTYSVPVLGPSLQGSGHNSYPEHQIP